MFSPNFGSWAREDFSESGSFSSLPSSFVITGSFLSLAAIEPTGVSFTNRWDIVSNWTLNNNLNSEAIIKNSFTVTNGTGIPGHLIPPGKSGFASHLISAGAWNIRTEYPLYISGYGFSGQEARFLELSRTSPNTGWYSFFSGGGTDATIEIDVASVYDIYSGLPFGFTTGQESLTGLSRLSGIVGHGIYIDNGSKWDFIEVAPDGLRSVNHPEIALNLDLTQPKRIRLGITSSNIYIATEDGAGIGGISKFNTVVYSGQDPKICFGAPFLTGQNNRYPFIVNGISGFAGETLWDNIKILLGKNTITETTGVVNYFDTTNKSFYTEPFEPGIHINSWNSATIYHSENRGGVTRITAQYSGATTGSTFWHNQPGSVSAVLTGRQGPTIIDLSTMPIYSTSRSSNSHNRIGNPIRFNIQMQSNGTALPPAIDSITVSASTEQALLDLLPNWKPVNQPAKIQIGILSGKFFDKTITADQYTTLLVNSPDSNYTILTGNSVFAEDSVFNNQVSVFGTVETIPGDSSSNAIRNILLTTGRALSGSAAANLLGTEYRDNYFYNPMLDLGFTPVTGDPAYIDNRSFGNLAIGMKMIPAYTGQSSIIYQAQQVYIPSEVSSINRINSTSSRSTAEYTNYVQSVIVPASSFSGTHNGKCGYEVLIPSGIATGNILLSFDLQVPYGTGLSIYATGSVRGNQNSWVLNGANYRNYRNVSFPIFGNTGAIYLGLAVPTGTPSTDYISWNTDNFVAAPYLNGNLFITGVPTFTYQSGIIRDSYTGFTSVQPTFAGTTISLHSRILAYPTGTNNSIINKNVNGTTVFNLYLTNSGNLALDLQTTSKSKLTGYNTTNTTIETISHSFVSDYQVPIGVWNDLGVTHQSYTYNKFGQITHTGVSPSNNIASCNRVYITVNGSPVGVQDLQSHWINYSAASPVPINSYISDGTGTVTVASGLPMDFAGVKISRPVIADTEIDQSIKYSKINLPYFVPPQYFNPGADSGVSNSLVNYVSSSLGKDFFLGSIYNFDGPGYTNWDHGPWGNHLLFYGNLSKLNNNPYGISGLGSTYIPSGSYAIAKYSSTTERQINNYYNLLGIIDDSNYLGSYASSVRVGGWIYPYHSGKEFFKICQSDTDLGNNYVSLAMSTGMNLVVKRKTSTDIWSVTGTHRFNLTGWNFFTCSLQLGSDLGPIFGGIVPTVAAVRTTSLTGTDIYALPTTNYATQAYYGKSGDTTKSCFVFGRDSTAAFSDWFITPINCSAYFAATGDLYYDITGGATTGSKGGRSQVLLINEALAATQPSWVSYKDMSLEMPANSSVSDVLYSMAIHNKYDNFSRMNGGMLLYDDVLFRNTEAYYIDYNLNALQATIGNNNSPIRIGNQVPDGAVNLSKISSIPFSADNALSIVDLSFKNTSNLSSYKDGIYTISRNNGILDSNKLTGSFNGVNSGIYLERKNLSLSGQAYSKDILITSAVIGNPSATEAKEAFYGYLLGRGNFAVKIDDAYPHPTGNLDFYSSGSLVNNYISNLTKIKNSIKIKDSNGTLLSEDEYPFSVVSSPYTSNSLVDLVDNYQSFNINGIGTYTGAPTLPDGTFSVVLLTNKKTISEDTSVWAYYTSSDIFTNEIDLVHREIINPVPLMRTEITTGIRTPGRYNLNYNHDNLLYTVNIFGLNSGYTTKL